MNGASAICPGSHEITTQPIHSVCKPGWQAKMVSIEFWIP